MTSLQITTSSPTQEKTRIQHNPILIHQILNYAAEGLSPQEIVEVLPQLTLEEIKVAFRHAANVVTKDISIQAPTQIVKGDKKHFDIDLHKILVVDDTPMNIKLVEAMFWQTDFKIVEAYDGIEALEAVNRDKPFLVLTDIQMPRMNGFELCQKIKGDEGTKNIAVIFVTAYDRGTGQASEGLNMGADDFIFRPFDRKELLARVEAVARLKRAELEAQYQAQIAAERSHSLEMLNELAITVSSSLDFRQIFTLTMEKLSVLLQAEAVAIVLIGKTVYDLTIYINLHSDKGVFQKIEVDPNLEITDLNIQKHIPALILQVLEDNYENLAINLPTGLQAITSFPMVSKEETIGSIAIINRESKTFTQAEWALLISVLNIITVGVDNARLFHEVQEFNTHLGYMVEERTKELADEKKKIEAILVSMADGVLVVDADNLISSANTAAEKMLGFKSAQLLGTSINVETLNTPLWDCVRELAASEALTTSRAIDVRDQVKRGQMYSIQARSAKIRTATGHTIGSVIVLADITSIIEVERMKGRIITGVTHELKTPLAIIKLHSNNLTNYHTRLPEQKREDLLKSIQGQVKLLEDLVENILTLARLGVKTDQSEYNQVDLVAIGDRVINDIHDLAHQKLIHVTWTKPLNPILIDGDATQINHVIRNLLSNAIKFTPDNGSVKMYIGTQAETGQPVAVIEVSDTGIGIPPEDQTRIFERFYRVDTSHTIPGTGLGLSIVKEIVTAHNGDISLQSTPGKGSIFTVVLPMPVT